MKRTPLERKTPLKRTAPKPSRKGFSPASPEQRSKVRGAVSIVSGESPCDPAHITPRSMGGCDHELCVVPLTRTEHRAFDMGVLDILPYLISHGKWAELAHAIEAHHVDPISLLNRLTGDRYVPERSAQ